MLTFQEAEDYFGVSRMQRYLIYSNGDQTRAVELYLWNSRVAASYWPDIESVEILIRNRIARELFPDGWITETALASVTTGKYSVGTVPRRISDQSFGFWTYLLSTENQNSIWNAKVHKHFSPGVARKKLFSDLKYIQRLRNGIGHHASLVGHDFAHTQIVFNRIFQAVSDSAGSWLSDHIKYRDALLNANPMFGASSKATK